MRGRKEQREKEKVRVKRNVDVGLGNKGKERVKSGDDATLNEAEDLEVRSGSVHSRALSAQLLQEMKLGLIDELRHHLSIYILTTQTSTPAPSIEFWTTPDARDRCMRIVDKIGGMDEKRRAAALFACRYDSRNVGAVRSEDVEDFWLDSRHTKNYLPVVPVKVFGENGEPDRCDVTAESDEDAGNEGLWLALEHTCDQLLATKSYGSVSSTPNPTEFQRAPSTQPNRRLTTHTVHSLREGVRRRWTTLTANRASVREVVRELEKCGSAEDQGAWAWRNDDLERAGRGDEHEKRMKAILWTIAPRSLAEGMRGYARDEAKVCYAPLL